MMIAVSFQRNGRLYYLDPGPYQPTVGTKGRILDHIGFDVNDLDAFLKKAAAAGVTPVVPATKNPTSGVSLAFIADPWGTYIELNQRPNQTYLDQM